MNNNERLVDDNSTVSIQDNEKESPMEIPKAEKQKKSSITIRELTIIGLLAGIFDEPWLATTKTRRSARLVDDRWRKDEQKQGQRRKSKRGRKRLWA